MAYQRLQQGQGQGGGSASGRTGGGYQKPVQQQSTQQPVQSTQQQSGGQGKYEKSDAERGSNKPDYRLALMVSTGDGKPQTQKGADGKTIYVAAAWKNKFDGLNIKFEGAVPAGASVRAYPNDGEFGKK